MSNIIATITNIDTVENLNIVKFDFDGIILQMMSLELNENIKVGTTVVLNIKSTHIALTKDLNGFYSFSNQIPAKVQSYINGKLLSSIKLLVKDVVLESIITSEASKNMNIQNNDDITILIQASDISIKEVI